MVTGVTSSLHFTTSELLVVDHGVFASVQVPFYVMVQLAGSVLACLSVNAVMRPRAEHFYGTAPMAGHTRLPFLLELLASAVLMVVIATAARGSVRTPTCLPSTIVSVLVFCSVSSC